MPPKKEGIDMQKEIGKIKDIRFGYGGYQDSMFGISTTIGGKGWVTNDFKGTWAMDPSKNASWTKQDQSQLFSDTTRWLIALMDAAKVRDFVDLKNVPIEATFENGRLKEWRILTEVI